MKRGILVSVLHFYSLVRCFSVSKYQEANEEVTREEPTVSYVSSVNNLLLIEEPIAGEFVGPLYQQPSLMAVDEQVRQRYICKQIALTTQLLLNQNNDTNSDQIGLLLCCSGLNPQL